MKPEEIRDLTGDELIEKIEIEEENYAKMHLNHTVAALENPMLLRGKRRLIARMRSDLRRREIAEQTEKVGKKGK